MPIIVLTILAQLFCAYHVVKTGRDKYWIGLIIMVPGIGCAIYFITQVLGDAGNSRTATNLKKTAATILDPHREYREALNAFDMVESVENRLRLADALIGLGKDHEAEPLLMQSLAGTHKHDPHIMMRLASVKLRLGDAEASLSILDELQKENPGFRSQGGHLLYCRSLEALGRYPEALTAYADLVSYTTGEEARVRYGTLLAQTGHTQDAQAIFEEVVKRVDRGTKFYRKEQKEWRTLAANSLTGL